MKRLNLMYFSPNGNTKTVARNIAEGMTYDKLVEYDLTDFDKRWDRRKFTSDDFVLIALPAIFGRVVNVSKEIFNRTKVDQAKCAVIVTYGNDEYKDALLEAYDYCQQAGFEIVGGAAFVTENRFDPNIGTARPDESDKIVCRQFGRELEKKLQRSASSELEIPGDRPYVYVGEIPLAPVFAGQESVKVDCPVKAIDPKDPSKIDVFRCNFCMKCAVAGYKIENPNLLQKLELLKLVGSQRKEPETFI